MSRTAAPGAKEQVARLLMLVPYLHARGEVRLGDAAAALGVSSSQLLSDLKVLLMCGLPGGYPDDLIDVDLDVLEGPEGPVADGVIRVSNADYLSRPLRLSPTEATAIIVALRALRDGAGEETREIVDRTLAKLETAAASGPAAVDLATLDPGEARSVAETARLRARLEDAVARRRQVRLVYYVPTRDEESDRVVDPRGVVTSGGVAYLDAWCHSAEAPRLFRLDRIRSAQVLESPVATVAPPRDLSDGMFSSADDATLVTLLLERPAHWIVEYYPVEAVRQRRGGRLEVQLLVADNRWLQRLLLRLAPHASVVSPEGYAEEFSAAARATLGLYE